MGLRNDDQGHNFTFSSPPSAALQQRDKFKNELTNIIARNRQSEAAITLTAASKTADAQRQSKPAVGTKGVSDSRVPSPAPSRSRSPNVTSSGMTPEDFRLCKNVLLKNPDLAKLHRNLVLSGQISEAEFWDGRQVCAILHKVSSFLLDILHKQLLRAEAAAESQVQGRPGKLVDPRPETLPSGEIKMVITPQLVHDIFDEFPVVAKAYNEHVPKSVGVLISVGSLDDSLTQI